jgi:hypothetical protein
VDAVLAQEVVRHREAQTLIANRREGGEDPIDRDHDQGKAPKTDRRLRSEVENLHSILHPGILDADAADEAGQVGQVVMAAVRLRNLWP